MRKFQLSVPVLFIVAISALAIAIASWSLQLDNDERIVIAPSDAGTSSENGGDLEEYQRLFEVRGHLQREHFSRDSLDDLEMSRGAVRGLLEALDDPYATYVEPAQHAMDSQDFQGFFEGIGAEVTLRDGRFTIVTPLPDTPAEKAGLRPGDVILEINGESTEGISLQEAVSKIRGPQGESVNLLILRTTGGEPIEVTIVRDAIKVESVRLAMLVGRIARLTVTTFSEDTEQQLVKALQKVKRLEGKGIILDLRNNPGGLLNAVVETTSHFLEGGLVLYEVDGNGRQKDWPVRSGGLAKDIPLVVLVNGGSASGSEVMAGAIKDAGRAPIIGTKTFGKGSVNTLRTLSDGAGLYFTIARWYTPNGTLIEGEGLEPDIEVENSEDGKEDFQLDKALDVLESEVKAREKTEVS